jgi:pSer/pThr/pTyr-binding forkhead associated (FHA) protein
MPKLTVTMDGVLIKEIELTQERTTLGRRPYNDIVIDNLAVSGEHAVLHLKDGQVTIEDLHSTNGTYVNGKAVKTEALQDQDLIEIGRYKVQFEQGGITPPAIPPAAPQVASVRVLSGPAAGREAPLVKVVTTLGKPGVAVAAITQRSDGYTVALVDGRIAPRLNGHPLGSEPVLLHHEDIIELDDTRVQFRLS